MYSFCDDWLTAAVWPKCPEAALPGPATMHHELLLMALERKGGGGAGVGGESFPSFPTHVFFNNRKV